MPRDAAPDAVAVALDMATQLVANLNMCAPDREKKLDLLARACAQHAGEVKALKAKNAAIDGLLTAIFEANGYDDLLVMANTCGWAEKWLNPACKVARAARGQS